MQSLILRNKLIHIQPPFHHPPSFSILLSKFLVLSNLPSCVSFIFFSKASSASSCVTSWTFANRRAEKDGTETEQLIRAMLNLLNPKTVKKPFAKFHPNYFPFHILSRISWFIHTIYVHTTLTFRRPYNAATLDNHHIPGPNRTKYQSF